MKKSGHWKVGALMMVVGLSAAGSLQAAEDPKLGAVKKLAVMSALGRKIVSENQSLINDATKEDKGFTAAVFADKLAKAMMEEKMDLAKEIKKGGLAGKNMDMLLQAMQEVITDAQPLINKKDMGFKGFLPALFARKSFETFNQKGGVIKGKLTALQVRNVKNSPDAWEKKNLEKFVDPSYPVGKAISEVVGGELRYMKPEYYTVAGKCLNCHGEPKGERDISGGLKEGYKDGQGGSALSFIIKE
ncbi:MAG TPA: hypothetical protein DCZ01_10030 [Elusimicrobia bacterium]|nr:hypothetical protein [Elusimicrobiota bacterium]